jgi:thiopurine S-methyltransferase
MEISYWQSRWRNDKTGWHMRQVYPYLVACWHKLNLDEGSTVLVPLCGKSLDLHWLAERGHRVIGIEISEIAIQQFINDSKRSFRNREHGPFTVYSSDRIELWQGDVFKLSSLLLPHIDAIYDKAALIAFPERMRAPYARLMQALCSAHTQMFLNTLEYEQDEMTGPPFSVNREELNKRYGDRFEIHLLQEASLMEDVPKFQRRGLSSYLQEKVYWLIPK